MFLTVQPPLASAGWLVAGCHLITFGKLRESLRASRGRARTFSDRVNKLFSSHVVFLPYLSRAAGGTGVGRKKYDVQLMAREGEGRTRGHLWHILFRAEPKEINAVTGLISSATCLALDFEMY